MCKLLQKLRLCLNLKSSRSKLWPEPAGGLAAARPSLLGLRWISIFSRPLRSPIERGWDGEGAPQPDQDQTQKFSQPGEDTAEVIAYGREDDVGGVAGAAFEIAAAKVSFSLQMADHRLDGGAAPQLALDDAED